MTTNTDNLIEYHNENTREIEMPDGSRRLVRMSQPHWDYLEFLELIAGTSAAQVAEYALEEMELQPEPVSFNTAFRTIVAFLGNRWKPE